MRFELIILGLQPNTLPFGYYVLIDVIIIYCFKRAFYLADIVGFEPTHLNRPNSLAGSPLDRLSIYPYGVNEGNRTLTISLED